jgi:hypothetical protein
MKFTEILNESNLSEAKPRSKGADAFGQMARSVTGDKPNTMSNAPTSATNTPKPGNPNVPTFGKGTAMPTKPFQVPGAGTKPTPSATATSQAKPEVPSTAPEKSEVPATTPAPASSDQAPTQPDAASTPAADEKPGLMYKMGKGIGDFGRGFKIGYGGRMPTDADVVPDEVPASPGGTGDKAAVPVEKTISDYARIKSNIDKLDKRSKRQLLTNLKKELGITSTPVAATVPAKAGKDAFGAMTSQLTGKPSTVPSSTGGQTTKTPTGVQHQAKPIAPVAKATKKTGGKVPGVVSQTPNAVRKRNARAAKPIQKSSYENTDNAIIEGFSLYRKQL